MQNTSEGEEDYGKEKQIMAGFTRSSNGSRTVPDRICGYKFTLFHDSPDNNGF